MRARPLVALAVALVALVAPATSASATGSPPDVPTDLGTSSGTACVVGPARPSVGSLPSLYARGVDPDGGNLGLTFEWWRPGGARVGEATTAPQASGSFFAAQIPPGAFADGDDLAWRARATDGTSVSAWSPFCELHLDRTPPGIPTVVVERTPVVQGDRARLRFVAAPSSGTVAYRWTIGGASRPDCVPTVTDGDCEVAFDANATTTVVEVVALDTASNRSDPVDLRLELGHSSRTVGDWEPVTIHPGLWRSLLDPPLTLRPSESAVTTRALRGWTLVDSDDGPRPAMTASAERTLRFDGVNDLVSMPSTHVDTTSGVSVVVGAATRTPYGGRQTVAAVAGSRVPLLTLGYDGRGGIEAVVRTADDPAAPVVVAAAGPTRLTRACHLDTDLRTTHQLGASLDARLGQLRLYVDGCIAARVPVAAPWQARGPFVVGTGWSGGAPDIDALFGSVSQVRLYQGGAYPPF